MKRIITLSVTLGAACLALVFPSQGHAHGSEETHIHEQNSDMNIEEDAKHYLEEEEEAKEETPTERRKRKRKELHERRQHAKEHRRERARPNSSTDTHHH